MQIYEDSKYCRLPCMHGDSQTLRNNHCNQASCVYKNPRFSIDGATIDAESLVHRVMPPLINGSRISITYSSCLLGGVARTGRDLWTVNLVVVASSSLTGGNATQISLPRNSKFDSLFNKFCSNVSVCRIYLVPCRYPEAKLVIDGHGNHAFTTKEADAQCMQDGGCYLFLFKGNRLRGEWSIDGPPGMANGAQVDVID